MYTWHFHLDGDTRKTLLTVDMKALLLLASNDPSAVFPFQNIYNIFTLGLFLAG